MPVRDMVGIEFVLQDLFFYICDMSQKERAMLRLIKSKIREVIPSGVQAYLYGSRARGEARDDSDWDILILVNSSRPETELYDTLAYSLTELGWKYGEVVIPVIYSRDEWNHPSSLLFRRGIEQDAIPLT